MDFAFICHADEDRACARDLGAWLERNSSVEVRYTPCAGVAADDLIEAAEQSMAAAAVILLLSPASVPGRWRRERWEPVLLDADARPRIAYMQLSACTVPELLRRQPFFDATTNGRRALKRWLLGLFPRVVHLPGGATPHAAAEALEELRGRLADEAGEARGVDAETARAFAVSCERDFEGVIWLDCTRRSRGGITGDLCAALGLTVPGVIEENEAELRRLCASRRLLIVCDNAGTAVFPREGKVSLITTAAHTAAPPAAVEDLAAIFARWQQEGTVCMEALRDVPTAIEGSEDWKTVRRLGWDVIALLGRQRERSAELLEVLELLIARAWDERDDEALRKLEWERGWIQSERNQARPNSPAPMPGEQIPLF